MIARSVIHKGDYKRMVFFNDHRRKLYNLKEDIGEKQNLAAKTPELADKLHGDLKLWWKEFDA